MTRFAAITCIAIACGVGCSPAAKTQAKPAPPIIDAAPPATGATPPADLREATLAGLIDELLTTRHLRRRPVNDSVSIAAFDEYLKALDPGKMFLLKHNVATLRQYATKMDDQLKSGRLFLAQVGAEIVARRLAVVKKMVASRLKQPFDFNVDESVETDSDKLDYAHSDAELAERWRKVLKLDVLARIVRLEEQAKQATPDSSSTKSSQTADGGPQPTDIPKTARQQQETARRELAKRYDARFARLANVNPLDAAGTFLNAIARVYGPHTAYMPPIVRDNFDIQMSGSLEGIGAVLSEKDHYIRVVRLVPGGASWRQGDLAAEDIILGVKQQGQESVDIGDMRINQVVKMIRGPKGTVVTLTVRKPDNTIHNIAITRDIVEIEAAYARAAIVKPRGTAKSLGYVYLPSFYGNTRVRRGQTPERRCTEDVRKILSILAKRRVAGVVIDVRGNGGGLLADARDITGLFIKTGPVVQTRHANGQIRVLKDEDPTVVFSGPVVILVDRFSASASEILAAALKDYGRAVIVGTGPTHGKGTVQALIDLDRVSGQNTEKSLGVFKLTIQQFFRIDGGSTQLKGVTPDILLPDPTAHIESGERQLDHAIPWSKTKPVVAFETWPKSAIATLRAASQARVRDSKYFQSVQQRTALLKTRRDHTVASLAKKKWLAERNQHREQLKKISPDESKSPPLFKVTTVDYDNKAEAAPTKRNGKPVKSVIEEWRENISRDPWVNETLHILVDMLNQSKH